MNTELIRDAVSGIIHVAKRHKALIGEGIESFYPHRTAHMMLMHLSKTQNCSSQRELAQVLQITPAAVTGILKKLEADGYIVRTLGTDSRFNVISITDLGREIVERTKVLFHSIDESLFADFTEEELALFVSTLHRIEQNIQARGKEGDVK